MRAKEDCDLLLMNDKGTKKLCTTTEGFSIVVQRYKDIVSYLVI